MPVLAKFCGIVIRLLCLRGFSPRLHACCGDSEIVLELATLKVIETNVSEEVKAMVLAWARQHQREFVAGMLQPNLSQALAEPCLMTA